MTHGSVFSAAGQAVLALLSARLPEWRVNYEMPRNEAELAESGAMRAVWLDPEGESDIQPDTTRGWRETCPVTVVFHRIAPRTQLSQGQVDDDVAEAFGELLDMISPPGHRLTPPDGWDSLELRLGAVRRTGGYLEGVAGLGRRLEVTVEARAARC